MTEIDNQVHGCTDNAIKKPTHHYYIGAQLTHQEQP